MKKAPMRMCVICREKQEKRSLTRIVRTPEGELVHDPTGKRNGRGAYICAKEECRDLIKNRKRIVSALEVDPTPEQLVALMENIKNHMLEKK
jgi:predicted RNA-binding protein YlxR (DUF448 family)